MARQIAVRNCLLAFALLMLFGQFGASALAGDPKLSSFTPLGGSRGSEITIRVGGNRLSDANGLLCYEPGITVLEVTPVKDNANACDMKLAIAADCRIGLHPVRVRTATGLSNMKFFSVSALAQVLEKKPNNDAATAQKIELDTSVIGTVVGEEVDYYVVEAKRGERITAEIEALRLGRETFDPYIAILDANEQELATSDDDALLYADAVVSVLAPADGKYFVTVREATFTNGGNYRLHVGRFPRPRAIFPAGGKIGETVSVKLIGDLAGEKTIQVTLPKEAVDNYGIYAQDDLGIAPSPNAFKLSAYDSVLEVEPNDDIAHATPIVVPGTAEGVLAVRGDVDCFKFAAKKGQQYELQLFGRVLRSPIDSFIQVLRAGGAVIASNDDANQSTPDSQLRFTAPADEDCVVLVKDMLGEGSPEHVYHLEVRPVEPALALSLPELKRYIDIVAEVPRGNRMAVMMSVARRDCAGEVQVDLRNLPAGVQAEVVPVSPNETNTPVLLTATEDAPLAGSLVDVVGRLKLKQGDVERTIEGHLGQQTELLRSSNNRPLLMYPGHHLSSAVIERLPFKLELVEPKVPLVRNGAMELKVRVVRDKDFNLPVTLRMVYNPPGVSSSGSVKIAESQNEGLMPLTANKDALTGKFRVAVVGEVALDGGPVTAATQLVDLEVAEPFFAMTFKPVAVDQGKETDFVVEIENNKKFAGMARAELLGLPAEATAEPVEFNADAEEIKFHVKTTGKTTGGRHKAIMCRAIVTLNDEPITHILGPGELRVDVPLQKKDAGAKKPAAAATSK
jgi:hypothetical protein